ncbi:signal peptidase I [Streptomyces sp. NPDC048361]|uniref:signal peptidase I n=1 Tax=Streptomyces sp. NPDC048361 TaxID=3154720 RepID=UPI00342C9AB4
MGDSAVGAGGGTGSDGAEPNGPVDPARGPGDPARGPGDPARGPGDPARGPSGPGRGGHHRSFWRELPILIGVALVLALLIKTFLLQAFSIPSESMQNTLQPGDRVLVDKLTPWFGSEPGRGEVVVFHDPDNWLRNEPTSNPNVVQKALSFIGLLPSANEHDLIKRVIGVAGDTVECKGTGPLTVNGKALVEPYVYPGNTPCTNDQDGGQFRVTVPKGKMWVMGDHRQDSEDSRYHQADKNHGLVPVDEAVGRAFVIAWPVTRWATLPVPDTFGQAGIGATAAAVAPGALALTGASPVVLWRRQRAAGRDGDPAR